MFKASVTWTATQAKALVAYIHNFKLAKEDNHAAMVKDALADVETHPLGLLEGKTEPERIEVYNHVSCNIGFSLTVLGCLEMALCQCKEDG